MTPQQVEPPEPHNVVVLRGRLGADAEIRTLPSGDELISFRLTVPRPAGRSATRATVDSIDCRAGSAAARRAVLRLRVGRWVEVTGQLHRRFWRTAAGAASRYEVEVDRVRVLTRPRSDA